MGVEKAQRVPFYNIRHCEIFLNDNFLSSKIVFLKILRFLSLIYSADFGRSRLVLFWSDHRTHPVSTTFCALCTFYQKYVVLDFERIQSLYHEKQNHCNAEGSLFNSLALWDFPHHLEIFNVSKGSSSIF